MLHKLFKTPFSFKFVAWLERNLMKRMLLLELHVYKAIKLFLLTHSYTDTHTLSLYEMRHEIMVIVLWLLFVVIVVLSSLSYQTFLD